MKSLQLVRAAIVGFILTSFITSFSFQWSNPLAFQEKLRKSWEKYILYPTTGNILELIKIIPDRKYNEKIDEDIIDMIFVSLDVVDNGVHSKDRNAIRLAIKLINISDGAFTEVLLNTIGKLIKVDGALFLEEIDKSEIKNDNFYLEHILAGLGQFFVDKNYLEAEEIKLRIKSLENVKKSDLNKIKEKCIKILNVHLNELYKK